VTALETGTELKPSDSRIFPFWYAPLRIETEPAINDDVVKQQAEYDSFYTDSERELKRKARETRS